jgi:hypothetical protein
MTPTLVVSTLTEAALDEAAAWYNHIRPGMGDDLSDDPGPITQALHFNPAHIIRGHPYTRFRTHADAGARLHYPLILPRPPYLADGGLPNGTYGLRPGSQTLATQS